MLDAKRDTKSLSSEFAAEALEGSISVTRSRYGCNMQNQQCSNTLLAKEVMGENVVQMGLRFWTPARRRSSWNY